MIIHRYHHIDPVANFLSCVAMALAIVGFVLATREAPATGADVCACACECIP